MIWPKYSDVFLLLQWAYTAVYYGILYCTATGVTQLELFKRRGVSKTREKLKDCSLIHPLQFFVFLEQTDPGK